MRVAIGPGDTAWKGADARSNQKAEVIAVMKRAKGATMAEIMELTSWAGALASKGGEKIESSKNSAGERTYRIAK